MNLKYPYKISILTIQKPNRYIHTHWSLNFARYLHSSIKCQLQLPDNHSIKINQIIAINHKYVKQPMGIPIEYSRSILKRKEIERS